MNYQETIDYLYNQLPVYHHIGGSAYKPGLNNTIALDNYLGYPHKKYRTIHIAGTNGKGSTSHLLAAVLQQAGYKTGLYTSPHLIDFRERIRVDGQMISEGYIVDFVANHKDKFGLVKPSFFELTMMMAFKYFEDSNVDVAVIEVGLGGRLDSTNIIIPDLSVITNISFDHVQFLGDTLEKIAYEKAGIIKQDIPVVVGEAEKAIRNIFQEIAYEHRSPIYFVEDDNPILSYSKVKGNWMFQTKKYPDLICGLSGDFQIKNAATVLKCIEILQNICYHVPTEAVYEGFANVSSLTGLAGRWHLISGNPRVICDTGHNIAGIEYIVKQLKNESYNHLHIIIGMVNDKDITNVLALLPKENTTYYFTQASISRALIAKELKEKAAEYGLNGNYYLTVKEAVEMALKNAFGNDLIFVGGSNFIVGEGLPLFS